MNFFRRISGKEDELGKGEKERDKNRKLLAKERKKREKLKKSKATYQSYVSQYQMNDSTTEGGRTVSVVGKSGIQKEGRLLVLADCYNELPPDVKESISRMKVDPEDIDSNFPILLSVLGFTDKIRPKRVFRTRQQQERVEKSSASSEAERCNIHPPGCLLPPEKCFESISIKDVLKIFKLGNSLGEGGFGQVFEAKTLTNQFPKSVAIKIVPHTTEKEKHANVLEASFLRHLDCPQICKAFHVYLVEGEEVWFVMELLQGGSLKEAARSRDQDTFKMSGEEKKDSFDEEHLAFVAREMLRGIAYLHDRGLTHRDLKSQNVMLSVEGKVKLIDLGLCVDVTKGPRIQMVGSPFWMAPEMIRGEPHSFPVDIWSFGISLLELANRRPPYLKNSKRAMFQIAIHGISQGEIRTLQSTQSSPILSPPPPASMGSPSSKRMSFMGSEAGAGAGAGAGEERSWGLINGSVWSAEFKNFLSRCEEMDQTKRATAKELLAHPFLKKASNEDEMRRIIKDVFLNQSLICSFS